MRKLLKCSIVIACSIAVMGCQSVSDQSSPTAASKVDAPYSLTRGFPTDAATIKKAQDASDLRRAIEAYKYFSPTVETEAVIQMFQPHGAVANKVGIIMPQDAEQQFSVANQDTPYIMANFDLRVGPMVINIPAGPYIGLVCDHNMSPVGDMGTIGSGKGKGEKNLILPPNYKGEIPKGYTVYQSETWEAVAAIRVVSAKGEYSESVALAQHVKIYPLSEASNPPDYKIIDINGQAAPLPMLAWEKDMEFWKQLHAIINEEATQIKQHVMMGMLAEVGIKKGEAFNPTPRQIAILTEAYETGNAEMRISAFANERPSKMAWEGKQWEWMPVTEPINADTKAFGNENYRDLEASDHFFFQAWGTTAAAGVREVGAGSIYYSALKDSTGTYLDGGKNYKLTIEGPVPTGLFWSATVYDSETRTVIDTDLGRGAIRMLFEKPVVNAEGNYELYFGPTLPEGVSKNHWVKTIPGKGWFTYVRIYSPKAPLFDGSYQLQDIELLK